MNIALTQLVAIALTVSSLAGQIFVDPAPAGNTNIFEARGVPSGQSSIFFEVAGQPGDSGVLLFSQGEAFIPFPPLGTILVDPGLFLASLPTTIGPDGQGAVIETLLPGVDVGLFAAAQAVLLREQGTLELSNLVRVFVVGPPGSTATLELLDPVRRTSAPSVTLRGVAFASGSEVAITGGLSPVTVTANLGPNANEFVVVVPLRQNQRNVLLFSEATPAGGNIPGVGFEVVQDSEPPVLVVDQPVVGSEVFEASVSVVGRVSDRLLGTEGLAVEVFAGSSYERRTVAVVNAGIGTNGTFEASAVGLESVDVDTPIRVVARDVLGNEVATEFSVTQRAPFGVRLERVGEAPSIVTIGGLLAEPVQVRVLLPSGEPFQQKLVTFQVVRSDGLLVTMDGSRIGRSLQVETDAFGEAGVRWRVGSDAGCGNNRVVVSSEGAAADVAFCASAAPGPATQLNVSSGNEQTAAINTSLPLPLRVWVSDSCNSVSDVPVVFEVIRGGGALIAPGGSPVQAQTVFTDETGHAELRLITGPRVGDQFVRVRFLDESKSDFAEFRIATCGPIPGAPTSFTGVVLDNSGCALRSAHVELEVGDAVFEADTNASGVFSIDGIDTYGLAELHVYGDAISEIAGRPAGDLRFPDIYYRVQVFEGVSNALPRCVNLPPLRSVNDVSWDPSHDNILRIMNSTDPSEELIAGLQMKIRAGTVITLADGSVAQAGQVLALNQVHVDDIPMAMTDGAAPPFAWTLQPAGARFDPPIEITYPNMSGLPPGSISYFLSFDHDTGKFEIVSSGTVSEDGARIVSDSGGGLALSGWGCNCPPYSVSADCEACRFVCVDRGSISFSQPTVSDSMPAQGDMITFSVSNVEDSGGSYVLICPNGQDELIEFDGVSVDVTWTIERPDGVTLSGNGVSASVVVEQCGVYECKFVASVARLCAPPSVPIGPVQAAITTGQGTSGTIPLQWNVAAIMEGWLASQVPWLDVSGGVLDPSSSAELQYKQVPICCPPPMPDSVRAEAKLNSPPVSATWNVFQQPIPGVSVPLPGIFGAPGLFADVRATLKASVSGVVSYDGCSGNVSLGGSANSELDLEAGVVARIISGVELARGFVRVGANWSSRFENLAGTLLVRACGDLVYGTFEVCLDFRLPDPFGLGYDYQREFCVRLFEGGEIEDVCLPYVDLSEIAQ